MLYLLLKEPANVNSPIYGESMNTRALNCIAFPDACSGRKRVARHKSSYHKQCTFYVKSAKKIYSRGTSSLQVRSQGSGVENEPHRLRCEFRLRSLTDDLAASSTNSQTLHGVSESSAFFCTLKSYSCVPQWTKVEWLVWHCQKC